MKRVGVSRFWLANVIWVDVFLQASMQGRSLSGSTPIKVMITTPFQDPRTADLLSRVSEDVSLLRQDVGHLLSHTARHTLPSGVRELADSARTRLASGKLYSSDQLRALRNQVNQPTTAWVGGVLVMGLIAAGVYLSCKSDGCGCCCEDAPEEEED